MQICNSDYNNRYNYAAGVKMDSIAHSSNRRCKGIKGSCCGIKLLLIHCESSFICSKFVKNQTGTVRDRVMIFFSPNTS